MLVYSNMPENIHPPNMPQNKTFHFKSPQKAHLLQSKRAIPAQESILPTPQTPLTQSRPIPCSSRTMYKSTPQTQTPISTILPTTYPYIILLSPHSKLLDSKKLKGRKFQILQILTPKKEMAIQTPNSKLTGDILFCSVAVPKRHELLVNLVCNAVDQILSNHENGYVRFQASPRLYLLISLSFSLFYQRPRSESYTHTHT